MLRRLAAQHAQTEAKAMMTKATVVIAMTGSVKAEAK
jgi:hypothetical protein